MNKYTELQSMMIQIADDGVEETRKYIESISNAILRFKKRDVFFKALIKMRNK